MASTVTAATMTVTLTEAISLNGVDYGGTNTMTIASINEISKRIVTTTNTEAIILAFGTAIAAGQFDETKVMYIRITNLDDTNEVVLTFKNENDDEFAVLLDKGQSFIYNGNTDDVNKGLINTMDAIDGTGLSVSLGDLVNITADVPGSSGETADLELLVACL